MKTSNFKLQLLILNFVLLTISAPLTFNFALLTFNLSTAHAGFLINRPLYIGLTDGLVGYWSFNGSDINATQARDTSGNGNHGTLTNGPLRTEGEIGQALNFDGADDYVNMGTPSSLNFTSESFTLAGWFKFRTLASAGDEPIMIAKGQASVGGYYLYYNVNNKLSFVTNQSAARQDTLTAANPITTGQWYHVAVTRNGASARIYVNGMDVTDTAATHVNPTSSAQPFVIGAYPPAPTGANDVNGLIDEVRVYNRALSADEIKRLYKMGATTKINVPRKDTLKDGLVGSWTFDGPDIAVDIAYDRSGNANNGTLTNGPVRTEGKIGQALNFDGTDDYLSIADANSLNATNVTLSAWVKTTTAGKYIIAKDPPGEENLPNGSRSSIADYVAVHKEIIILLALFLLSILGLGFYKSKQKMISANLIICAMAFSGAAALIYEVASTQALTYFFNSSSYSVATAIISFLLGLALGSFIISKYLSKISNPIKLLITLQVSASLYALFVLPQYGYIISAMSFLYDFTVGSMALALLVKFIIGIVFLLFPTIMLGASFPLASSLIITDIKTAGSDVGKLYSWDLIGAVLGALVSGFVLLSIFGLTLTFVFGAAMNLMAGLLVSKIAAKKMWLILLAAAVFIPLVAFAINSRGTVLSSPDWVKDESGLPIKQLAGDILFQENSPYGEIMVTRENDYTQLFIDKAPQCGTDYPILTQNLEILVKKLPKNQQALDIGLGCGYSSRLIGSSENIARLNVVEINPVMSKVIKYFNNEPVLDNKKISILNDDIMHYLARYQNKYDFINVDMSHAGVSNVAPFYTLEYFQLMKSHLAEGGTIRIWAAYGNYEYVRSFYQTLSQAFDNTIIKTGADWGNDYFSNIEFYIGAENLMPQTDEEKALQARMDKEPIQFISTLDNQMISQIWQAWGRPYYKDYFDAKIIQPEKDKPYIKDAYLFPLDVKPGDTMQAGVRVIDRVGVKSVKISFPHEKGTDWLEMKLAKGTMYDGFWSVEWKAHDTLDKEYESRMMVENEDGIKAEKNIKWSDAAPGCEGVSPVIGLDSGTYSATVGGTFSVTVALTSGSSSACTYSIQDNTSGSYATVPATDTDLDCNGATCTGSSLPLTKTLKCEAAGTYNIRGLISPSTASSVSTVTCSAAGKSDVPYGLNITSGGKGQIMFMSSGVTYSATSTTSINDNKWHYVLGTYDGESLKIYIDGVLEDTNTAPSGNLPIVAGVVRIGADFESTPGNFFDGLIDDVRVYNRALSTDEIKRLYKMGATTKINVPRKDTLTNGLAGYWTFDGPDMAVDTAFDRSGNANNGTLTNSPVRTEGKIGQALSFDGTSNVGLPLTPGAQGTASLWFSPKVNMTSVTNDTGIITAGVGNRNEFFRHNWAKASPPPANCNNGTVLSNGSIQFLISPSAGNYSVGCTTTTAWNAGTWYFLTATWNGSRQKMYVNGMLQDDVSQTQTGGWGTVKIGNIFGTLKATIDEVRVYNRALSAEEIKRLYNMGR